MPPQLSPALRQNLDAALRLPISPTKLALQIVPAQLRVWLADQQDEACRPWYILCLELYPRGKVINQKLHSPASQKPSPQHLLSFLLEHICHPPEGEERVRPTHVSFVEDGVTNDLRDVVKMLKVETGTLSLADGVDEYVKLFSDKLISMDKASRGDASERPGLLAMRGVTSDMGGELMEAAVEMFDAAPWERIAEHIALEIRLPSREEDKYRDRYYVTVLGSDKKVRGFALMASLASLRDKYRKAILSKTGEDEVVEEVRDEGDDIEGNRVRHAVSRTMDDIFVCAACGRRVGESVASDGNKYIDRCGGCRRLLYCNERCQKLDWRERHRHECQQATVDSEFIFKRDEWAWLQREVALLFLDPTSIPFDDLDASRDYGWKFVEDESPPLYPMPFVTVQGSTVETNRMDRPTAKEVGFITLIARALTECVSPPPPDGILHLASGVSISFAENLAESIHGPM